jgi:catechol 2,3-dioxygenase
MQLGPNAPLQEKGQVGLNHLAWRLESLDDLKDFYQHCKEKGQAIERIADHGISLGIYMRDPDGNGVEVFYEMPRAEWPVDYHVFTREKTGNGRFPGPWDNDEAFMRPQTPAPQPVAAQ